VRQCVTAPLVAHTERFRGLVPAKTAVQGCVRASPLTVLSDRFGGLPCINSSYKTYGVVAQSSSLTTLTMMLTLGISGEILANH
jgi:hypothetical protein